MKVSYLLIPFIILITIYLALSKFNYLSTTVSNTIFGLFIASYLAITLYYFVDRVVISNIYKRVENGLQVYQNPSYTVGWKDIPTQYFNPNFDDNMDLLVADFYWPSSRKSYSAIGDSWDFPSYDAIKSVLDKGARLLHLDIYSLESSIIDQNAVPIVRNSTINPLAQPLDFKKCLLMIRNNAWNKNANYPLILYLDIQSADSSPIYNKYCLYQIGRDILDVFSDKLINKIYGFNGRNNKYTLGEIPIKDMLGKVAIITNVYPTVGIFDELIHGVANGEQQFNQLISYSDVNRQYGGLGTTLTDKQSAIQHNYKYLSIVKPVTNTNIFNFLEPKDDLYNIEPTDAWSFGCQIVLMNYQLFDANMQTYIKMFADTGLVLKPDNLRLIPKPPVKIAEQAKPLYFGPIKLQEKGWFNQVI